MIAAVVAHAPAAIQKIPVQKKIRRREKNPILKKNILINIKKNEIVMSININVKRGIAISNMRQIRIVMIEKRKLKMKIKTETICNTK